MTAVNRFVIGTHMGTVGIGAAQNTALNGSGIAIAWIVQAESTGAITKIRFRYALRALVPPTYVLTIEGLDASGNPDGTDKGGGSPTATTFTPPNDTSWDGTIQEITLTNGYTPANAGEFLAITIRYSSGTADASNNSSITRGWSTGVSDSRGMPYNQTLSGGTWTKQAQNAAVAWLSGSTWNGNVVLSSYVTASAATAGHRVAMFITIPLSAGTIALSGFHVSGKFGAPASNTKIGVWDSSNTLVGEKTIDCDWIRNNSSNVTNKLLFDSSLTLTAGSKYYIGFEVVGATVFISGISGASANDIAGYPLGDVRGLATYNGSAWTESALTYPLMDLILSDITLPAGGSGGGILIGG